MALLRNWLNSAGATQVLPSSTSNAQAALTPTEIDALLGKPKGIILPSVGGKPLPNSSAAKNEALKSPDDKYAIALAREKQRIDAEANALKQKQTTKRTEFQKALDAAKAQRAKAEEDINAELLVLKPLMQALQPKLQNSAAAGDQYNALMARATALQTGLKNLDATYTAGAQKALDDFNGSAQAEYDRVIAPMTTRLDKATTIAQTLRDNAVKQSQFDVAYKQAKSDYDNAVTQHDKDYAAFKMWEAKKAMYDQDSANRQADIDAGRYAVNPYQFMAQGANLNEINALREQVNAGNLRPNMRVPDAQIAPEEVKDPGAFARDKPIHEQVKGPTVDADIATILGYTEPEPRAEDPALKAPSTEKVDTSSVTSGYTSPADKDKPKEPEKDSSGNPVIPPGTNNQPTGAGTLQETSSTAGAAQTTQQTSQQAPAAVAATPAPALPAQPTGAVAGQGNTTGQDPTQKPEQPPQEKPAPFTADEKKKEEQDSVF